MSRSRCRRSSISKQRGAEMSSRFTPPKTGAMFLTVRTISSTSLVASARGKRVDARERLEDEAFPLHHGERGGGADVPQPQHGGAVGHDGDGVLLDGEVVDLVGVVVDGHAHAGHPGRVRHREIVARLHGDATVHLDLPAQVHEERAVRHVDDVDALDPPDALHDALAVRLVGGLECDVAGHRLAACFDDVDGADVAPRLADRRRYLAQHAGHVGEPDWGGEAVAGDRRGLGHWAFPPIGSAARRAAPVTSLHGRALECATRQRWPARLEE